MPLVQRKGISEVRVNNTSSNPVSVSTPVFTDTTQLENMGLGLNHRLRQNNYEEIIRTQTYYTQTDNVSTTERTIGMPSGSSDDILIRLTTESQIQFSSTNANDTSAGTGCRTIFIEGLTRITGAGGDWEQITETVSMNGQTAVTTTSTKWWRINKIFVNSSGSTGFNEGDIYCSPVSQALTSGVPDANTLSAMLLGYGVSTCGQFSTATGQNFQFLFGNFWVDPTKTITIHEFYFEDFAKADNLSRYEIALYPGADASFDYRGYAPYSEESDVCLTCFTDAGTADKLTYYVQAIISDTTKTNP